MDFFNLKFHNSNVKNEIFAGITMFMAMSYIFVVCPQLLSQTGMNYNGVFLATVCVSGFSTIVSAFYTRLPLAYAPGLGILGMFVSLASGEKGLHWSALLLATYVSGILIGIFVHFGIFDKIMEIMDVDFRRMIMSGIGFALFLYGLSTTGLLEKRTGYYAWGQIDVIPLAITAVSILVIYLAKRKKRKEAVFLGLLVAFVLGIGAGYYEAYVAEGISVKEYLLGTFSVSYDFQNIGLVMFAFPDVTKLFADWHNVVLFFNAVFVFTLGHFFDAIGTNTASFDAINLGIDSRMKDTVSLKRAVSVDGVGSIVSGLVGTSTVTAYAESMVGIGSGGKTGITALTTGCLFLLCMFFSPLFTSMGSYVAAPALIVVGLTLAARFREFDRRNKVMFLFGQGIILYVGITFNIGKAVLFGLLIYTVIKMVKEKRKPTALWWVIPIFAVVHILLNLM